ncbi:MAG: hypothetical protein JNG85_08385 [Spirochaetaceae bacterium]|nr:hypothetical protein [Spirochaetaceae bacterium]
MLPKFYPEIFFPGAQVTTRFGWDLEPPGPRIHHAIDKAGRGIVCAPFGFERVEWIDRDALGCSVLRCFADSGQIELRILHFLKAELSPGLADAISRGRGLPAGAPLAPAGNVGLSLSRSGGDGRHVHYSLLLDHTAYGLEMTSLRPGWGVDKRAEFTKRYGPEFEADCKRRQVRWISEVACGKHDPWTQRERVIVDSMAFFGF